MKEIQNLATHLIKRIQLGVVAIRFCGIISEGKSLKNLKQTFTDSTLNPFARTGDWRIDHFKYMWYKKTQFFQTFLLENLEVAVNDSWTTCSDSVPEIMLLAWILTFWTASTSFLSASLVIYVSESMIRMFIKCQLSNNRSIQTNSQMINESLWLLIGA